MINLNVWVFFLSIKLSVILSALSLKYSTFYWWEAGDIFLKHIGIWEAYRKLSSSGRTRERKSVNIGACKLGSGEGEVVLPLLESYWRWG